MKRMNLVLAALVCGVGLPAAAEVWAKDFRIRDPFVLADAKAKTYYLYGVEHYCKGA